MLDGGGLERFVAKEVIFMHSMRLRTRVRATATVLLMASFGLGWVAQAAPGKKKSGGPIGYVNLQRAIQEVQDGKDAQRRLRSTYEEKAKKLKEREEELLALRTQLEEAQKAGDSKAFEALRPDYEKKAMALQTDMMKEQKELKELEGKALSGITSKLEKIIKEMGKSGNYLLIMEAQGNGLLFAKAHLDLTNEVIRRYNARHGK